MRDKPTDYELKLMDDGLMIPSEKAKAALAEEFGLAVIIEALMKRRKVKY